MMTQPRLFEFRMGERAPGTLVVTEANGQAARLLQGWRAWPGGTMALVGPPGAGKTHLALAWALEAGARALSPHATPEAAAAAFLEAEGRLLLDDCESGAGGSFDEGMLWRLIDLARARAGAVLLVGVGAPAAWGAQTPDLRSRLAALPLARLEEPDGALLEVVLRRFCREQFIHLSDDAAKYLVRRLPRTFAAARAVTAQIEADLAKPARPVSLQAAKRALERAEAVWAMERE